MPINNITQTISTIPEAAHRGVDVQTLFVTKQEDFQDHLQGTTVKELNGLVSQQNTMAEAMNSTATQVNTNANTATTKAGEASTSASSASTSASEALTSRNQAETFKNNASTSASTATTKAGEASASALSASTSASTATTKASEASASALSASTSASTATTKASEASTSASTATTKASEALTSRNQAETFAQQASASALSVDVNNIVHRTGNETIAGVKTFSSNIVGNITGNSATATKLISSQGDWVTSGVLSNVVGMLAWKNSGNGHAIFDASNGTAPNGVAVNNTNASIPWGATYPTLMGWNGSHTHGVRVDSARVADSATNAQKLNNQNWYWNGQGGQPTWLWGGSDGANMYVYNPSNFSVNYANSATYATAFTTAVGSAPSYACRAWVNFNGTGTVAIRAGGNVSSITDNGVGDYTVNFTTAMPDNNYIATVGGNSVFGSVGYNFQCKTYNYTTSNFKVSTPASVQSVVDWDLITIQVTR